MQKLFQFQQLVAKCHVPMKSFQELPLVIFRPHLNFTGQTGYQGLGECPRKRPTRISFFENHWNIIKDFGREEVNTSIDMIRNKTGRFFNVMNDFFCFIIDSKATIIQTLLWFNLRVKFYPLAGRKSKKLTSTPMIIYFIHFSRARTISLSGKSHKISQKMRKKDSGLPASTKSRKRYIEPAVP